jgi:3-oxoacyl-[acyl-carrier-protein] synthase II
LIICAEDGEVVITGMGVISPVGVGTEAFWQSLCKGRSGVRKLSGYDPDDPHCPIGGEVLDFDPAEYVRPRKSLKVMNRDIQLACASAQMACEQAGLGESAVQAERLGVVFGADRMGCDPTELALAYRQCTREGRFDFNCWGELGLAEMFPLWMLKFLPNMPACHIGIGQKAFGPTNAILLNEVSSLSAIAESVRVIGRGRTDAMIAGGTSSRVQPVVLDGCLQLGLSERRDDPAAACRPFDAHRDGHVLGEGAGAMVLERRRHAEARGATILARILGIAQTYEPHDPDRPRRGEAIRRAIRSALDAAGMDPAQIGHVNADGLSTRVDDPLEAQAIRDTLGDVPVTAPKSLFGNLVAGTGAVEAAVSVLALNDGRVPPTLNYEQPDPGCPVNVVHDEPMKARRPTALVLNHGYTGRSVAMVLAGPRY